MTITMNAPLVTGPPCKCGCGEYLPIGSTREYKRGHKARVNSELADQIEQGNGVFDGYNFQYDAPYNTEPIDPYSFIDEDNAGWETIQDAASSVPNDPEGNLWDDPSKPFQVKLSLPKRVQADIEGKIAFMLSTTGMAVGIPDPFCGNAILQNTPQIAKALTPIICQSPGIVQWFQKTSNIMLYVNLAMACAPVIVAVMNHHLPSRQQQMAENGQVNIPVDPSYYGVQ
jgi:hypothetical protein